MSHSPRVPDLRDRLEGPPSGYFVVVPSQAESDSIDLEEVFRILLASWKVLLIATLVCAGLAAVISLQMRKTYRANALVSIVTQSGGGLGGALNSQFGGLAALAGIDFAGPGGRKEEYLATLSSPGFARDFIVSQNLLPQLFAEEWNASAQQWIDPKDPPTLAKAVRRFTSDVRTVSEDRKTGLVTVSVEWYSPDLAAEWANELVETANERLRAEAVRTAEQSTAYLENELAKTGVVEVRQAIYRLIEGQVNNAMLANVQHEYAFRFIDRAVPPDLRASPRRTMIVIVGGGLGFLLALAFVFARRLLRNPQ